MHIKTKNIKIIFFLIVFIFSCSDEGILSEDKFRNVYIDILVAQDTLSDKTIQGDSIKTLILQKYDVSDSVYANTIEYYSSNPDMWEKFFEGVIKQVEELKATQKK